MNEAELVKRFVELRYEQGYSIDVTMDILALEKMGIDPNEYYLEPSNGYPWNAWIVNRENGFSQFRAGLWWKYLETIIEISERLMDAYYGKYSKEYNKIFHEIYAHYSRIKEQLWKIKDEWRRIMS